LPSEHASNALPGAQRAVPFLKWAGGKGSVADRVLRRLGPPEPDSTYYEPFLGGGAVFFRLQPRHAVLSDLNPSLVQTYLAVKNRVEDLIIELERIPRPRSRAEYESIRTEFNESAKFGSIRRAALFLWLNHTCFNGLYRENQDGEFNVPFGYYKDAFIYDPVNLRAASSALIAAHAEIRAADYTDVLTRAGPRDQVYLDPPYDPVGETSNFTEYTSNGFGPQDQWRLADLFHSLALRGCRVVLSNSPTPDIRELYSDMGHDLVLVPRAINCDGAKRGRVGEMLIFPRHRVTLHDRFDRVVEEKGFVLDGSTTFEVSSAEVKRIGGAEPRLIAKMDTREQLPPKLAKEGYFLLPSGPRKYAVVPGEGYQDLDGVSDRPRSFSPEREIPVTIALKAGESAAIQTALYSGLLQRVIGVPQLKSTLHNDKVTIKDTEIRYGKAWTLRLRKTQVEVDAGFENHGEFYIFECKAWRKQYLRDFNIRQLFYPYVQSLESFKERGLNLRPRCFFLNVEPDTSIYRFWEYAFGSGDSWNDYSSIHEVMASRVAYRLTQSHTSAPLDLLQGLLVDSPSKTTYVPQADDPSKLVSLAQGVAEGLTTPGEIARRFQFDPRQAHYYGEAAEELGFIERERGHGFTVTELGRRVVLMDTDDAAQTVIHRVFSLPVFREIAGAAIANGSPAISADAIPPLIAKVSKGRYGGSTLRRRAQSVVAWLNWIGEVTGTLRVRPTPPPLGSARSLDDY
jgi:DNA adenine methylase